jgi:hypothetical protein
MRKRLLAGAAIVVLLTIPIALLLRDFAREVFLVELSRLYWGLSILIGSLPQLVIWGALLAFLLVIALRSLGRRQTRSGPGEGGREPALQGPVQVLTRWIQRAAQGEYFRWSLGQHLAKLSWDVMAQRARATPEQLKARLRAGRLDLPPVIEDYMQSTMGSQFLAPMGLLARLRARLRGFAAPDSFDPALESVVEFLEDQIQIVSRLEAEPPFEGR